LENPILLLKVNIEVDASLMADALRATGLTATDQVIELALTMLIQIKRQEAIKAFRGKLPWDGNLNQKRTFL
jgi:Arc/MetJ family transcription regulator